MNKHIAMVVLIKYMYKDKGLGEELTGVQRQISHGIYIDPTLALCANVKEAQC